MHTLKFISLGTPNIIAWCTKADISLFSWSCDLMFSFGELISLVWSCLENDAEEIAEISAVAVVANRSIDEAMIFLQITKMKNITT